MDLRKTPLNWCYRDCLMSTARSVKNAFQARRDAPKQPRACSWSACSSASFRRSRPSRAACGCTAPLWRDNGRKGHPAEGKAITVNDKDAELFTNVPDADDERGEWTPEELEAEEVAQIEAATTTAEKDSPKDENAERLWRREQELLNEMHSIAEKSRHLPDVKVQRLIDWIRENMCLELPPFGKEVKGAVPKWNNRRVLIFTENREGTK